MQKKFTKNTTLDKILELKGTEEVLGKNGVPCVTCPYMAMEMNKLKIGDICKTYNLKLDKILKELNA